MSEASGAPVKALRPCRRNGVVLDAWFLKPDWQMAVPRRNPTGLRAANQVTARTDEIRRVEVVPIRTEIASLQDAPVDVHDAYLRLHLLSHRLVGRTPSISTASSS